MKLKNLSITIVFSLFLIACGKETKSKKAAAPKKEEIKKETNIDPMQDKGIGPIKSITIGSLNQSLADEGKAIFKANCTACHRINKKYIGPALKGVTKRQSPEWIMNMILNPEEMVIKNKTAKELLAKYLAPMANQHLTEKQARAIYEYFRTKN